MKQFTIQIIILFLSINIYAQERKIQVGLQGGYYKADKDYKDINAGKNFGVDLRCFINDKLFISANATYGENFYLEDSRLNVLENIDYGNGRNAVVSNNIFGLTIGYQLKIIEKLQITGQIGVGSYTQINRYSYQYEDSIGPYQIAYTELVFPLKIGIGLDVIKHFNISIVGGTHILPDFPFAGTHLGPQLSYVF